MSNQWSTAARLLRRVGFGTTGPQVDALSGGDWKAYVNAALAADPDDDVGARATPVPSFPSPRPIGKGATMAQRKQFRRDLGEQKTQLAQWWIRRMLTVQDPIHEKLTLLWHNHFATSAAKVRYAQWMLGQNQRLRALKLGDFRTLAYAMLTDPAMMDWLDAQTNTAKSANENLSREFMELFALGHGNGYTEDDVRQGARALTGWTLGTDALPEFVAKRHDAGTKTILGSTGTFDAAGFCDAVLAHPASPGYVAGRLWSQLAGDTAPSQAALARLVDAYGPGRDLRGLTTAILTDDEFVGAAPAMVNTPVEWLIGVARSLRVPVRDERDARAMQQTLKTLGQQPFYPPDVGGWPHGTAWLSTASAGIRLAAANTMATRADLSLVEQNAVNDRIDATGYLIGIGQWSDRTVAALRPLAGRPPALVAAAVNSPEYLTS
ncbi:DUF1800 domain-containing protein [Mycolicibacterium sphagni]|uniref:DUF1800 domain-containing protein n=1 Tax=Mycolicibacterium sphagni TaxID=1786 RepID=A0A255DUI9_9MYCO|nr:DUF1800 domain-containing protein [Mycolicibacterium sphagni]MCV7179475.1 DUF1800 domain-containing protein [Mycolicibacterium sphagni]OYN83048.1 hypothetical protein CG716_01975 [Mycolicibacterium sphagni]